MQEPEPASKDSEYGSTIDWPATSMRVRDDDDGLQPSDVNISYSVHPWARGNGVAGEAVALICEFIRDRGLGHRAAIKVEPENTASVRVAQKAGFVYSNDFVSGTDTHPDGTAVIFNLYVLDL